MSACRHTVEDVYAEGNFVSLNGDVAKEVSIPGSSSNLAVKL
jgi:hypothetical protein